VEVEMAPAAKGLVEVELTALRTVEVGTDEVPMATVAKAMADTVDAAEQGKVEAEKDEVSVELAEEVVTAQAKAQHAVDLEVASPIPSAAALEVVTE
jgi:hypothetical protein